MKATIRVDGFLQITAETDLEAYALQHWARENIGDDWFAVAAVRPHAKILIDWSAWLVITPGGAELRAKEPA
ncbi:conserved hypothetical protein [Paraburkholderia caribensis]|uniref:hypothetical protein n=1 Tax=Paraburkholderia caribensis TaxID=75105 RepID=UPI001CB2E92A|nr:hypothetical protein [Paraburkholderia caribensis]CAG9194113.1 conserved hypothetical protein [Paraburkholderia caribensis]